MKQKQISVLKNCISGLDDQIELISDDFATSILTNPDEVENIISIFICEYDFLTKTKDKKIQECNTLEKEYILKKSEGPCTQQIEVILQQFKVQRQAYHGKSFIGNHVHKMLKVWCYIYISL